jgi:hypothetical protein
MPIGWGGVSLPGGVVVGSGGVTLPGGIEIGGKRKKSACRHVSPEDAGCFKAGTCASWVVADRVIDVSQAWGNPKGLQIPEYMASLGLTFEDFATVHTSQFVPLCDRMEGGEANYTKDPNAGPGLAIYEAARGQFKDKLRSGRISWAHAPRGGNGGDLPGGSAPGQGATPLQAGGGMLALIALGVFLLSQ